MKNSFNYEIGQILKNAEKEMLDLNHPYVGTEHLLLSLLKRENVKNICTKYNLTYDLFKQELIDTVGTSIKKSEVILYTPLLKIVINNANQMSLSENRDMKDLDLFNSLLNSDDGIALRILMNMNIDIDKLINSTDEVTTNELDTIGVNLNELNNHTLIGRDKEIRSVIEILLRKNKNNPVLIGECGVGKSAIVYELARLLKNGDVPIKLKGYKIISVDMSSMLSNTKYRGEFETRINNIIKTVKKEKNIILFIDEIHTIVKSGGSEGSIDAANILKPYLAYDDIKIIGATTLSEYERFIEHDKALSRRFERILVKEPNLDETYQILKGVKGEYENHHGVKISDENILDIIKCANDYIYTNHNPDKSLDVLDYACSRVVLNDKREILFKELNEAVKNHDFKKAITIKQKLNKKEDIKIEHKDIISVIESITNIKFMDKEIYNNLIVELDNKVYGQDLKPLKDILKRKLNSNKCLSICLKGSPHTGKTYTAKLIANTLNYNLIEIDGTSYSSSTSITKLIGSNPGYVGYEEESLLDKVKYQPYSLILIKNIEAISPKVMNLFKSIIENSSLKNNKGDEINFSNTMIIMTSNEYSKSIGYTMNKEDNLENIVIYNPIKKETIKEYITSLNINYDLVSNETNFKELTSLCNDNLIKS